MVVFIFSWDHCKSQQKMETMFMQNFEGQIKSTTEFLELALVKPLSTVHFNFAKPTLF